MELWMSAEIEAEVFDQNQAVRKEVEEAINARIGLRSYDLALDGWDIIVILRDDEHFDEITRYSARQRDMDFRLRLDYARFRDASHLDRCRMYVGLLTRSVELLRDKGLDLAGLARLEADVEVVARAKGWS